MTKDILANFLPIAACITRTRRTVWRGQPVVPDFARTGTAASAAAPVAANMPSSAVHIEVRRLRVMRARVYPEAARLAQTAFQPGSWLTSTTPQTLEWNAGLDVLVNATIPARLQAIRRHRVYPSRNPTGQCRVPALSGTIIIRRPCGPSVATSTSDRCRHQSGPPARLGHSRLRGGPCVFCAASGAACPAGMVRAAGGRTVCLPAFAVGRLQAAQAGQTTAL